MASRSLAGAQGPGWWLLPLRPSGGDFPPRSASLHEGNASSGLSGLRQVPKAACELSAGGSGRCGQKSRAGRLGGPTAREHRSHLRAPRIDGCRNRLRRGAALAWPAQAL